MRNSMFYSVFGAFFLGVLACSYVEISFVACLIALGAVAVALLVSAVASLPRRLAARVCAFAAAAFVAGSIRMDAVRIADHPLDAYIGKKISIEGIVCGDPKQKDATQVICFEPLGLGDKIQATEAIFPAYGYGDRLRVTGTIVLPQNFISYQGGPMFDYVSYLALDGVRYLMYRPRIEKEGTGGGDPVAAALFSTKRAIIDKIDVIIPAPQSALLKGILLGDRDAIPADILSDFKRTGLIHVVILSGYSVAIVIASILWALAFLPKTVGRLLAMLAIAAFVVMTGATAMTVRASIMAIVALAARGSGRRYDPSRGLVLAAALMVMMNPFILVYDSAFQISAISVLGLIYISPFVSEKISFVPKKFGLHEIVTATISAQAAVMPFILYLMGQISVISIIPNVLILPILPWAMLAALVSLIFGSVAPFLVWPVRLALSYMLSMTRFWSGLPFSTIQIAMSLPLLMAIYAAYVALLIFLYRKRQRNSLPLSAN